MSFVGRGDLARGEADAPDSGVALISICLVISVIPDSPGVYEAESPSPPPPASPPPEPLPPRLQNQPDIPSRIFTSTHIE